MFTIETSGKILRTPFYFPSISTVKTNYKVYDYFKLLKKVSYPGFLISSYDIYHDKDKNRLMKEVHETTDRSAITLLDSGNYEASWNNDNKWDINKLRSVLRDTTVDFCFSFDVFWKGKRSIDKHVEKTITYIAMTAGMQRSGTTIPIIHSRIENFPSIVHDVVEGVNPQIIGIAERDLGAGLLEKAKTLKGIRNELDKIEVDIPIHILGTGSPVSLLVYTVCGADLYDGLEWCKNVVNPETGNLYHFSQKDLIDCNCKACSLELPYHLQTLWHNLIFYEKFTEEMRQAIGNGKISDILNKYLPKKIVPQIREIAGVI